MMDIKINVYVCELCLQVAMIEFQNTVEPCYSANFRAFRKTALYQIPHYMKVSIYINDNSHCSPLASFKPYFRQMCIHLGACTDVSRLCASTVYGY